MFVTAAAIAYACAILPGNPHVLSYDKGNHGIAFATLAVLARLGWRRVSAWRIGAALVAFGGLIELSQALPAVHRDASWADLLADAIATSGGLLVGPLLQMLIDRTRRAPREL